jgi:hypothetical protein
MIRRRVAVFAVLATLMLCTGVNASAASPHFKHGGEPTCTITGSGSSQTVVCGASLAGLGNEDLKIDVIISGFAVYQCQNPGGNLVPGQNKVLEGPQDVMTTVKADQIKNGTVTFTTEPNTLKVAPTVSATLAGCPNGNWIGVNPTSTITQISMTISQGVQVLFTCTSASDLNGLTGTVALTC